MKQDLHEQVDETMLPTHYLLRSLQRKTLAWLLLIAILAASVRLFQLNLLPPFIDETIHIYSLGQYSLGERAIIGGKIFGSVIFYTTTRLTPDPLYFSRLLIASMGVITTIGMFLTTQRLGDRTAAIIAGLMWALLPFITFHDRLALNDPLVSFFIIWAIFFLITAVRNASWPSAWLSGFLLGMAIATKSSALIGLLWLLLIGFALVDSRDLAKQAKLLTGFAGGIALPLVFVVLVLAPNLKAYLQFADHFVETTANHDTRWQLLITNLGKVETWIEDYNSIFFALYTLLIIVLVIIRPTKIKIALLLSFLVSVIAYASVFEIWFPRYFIPGLIPLTILLALVTAEWLTRSRALWNQSAKKWITISVTGLLLGLLALAMPTWISTNLTLNTQPLAAQIPEADQAQYLHGWPSGTGLTEVTEFLDQLSRNETDPILVVTGSFGFHGLWSIPMMLKDNPKIEFYSLKSGNRPEFLQIIAQAARRPTFVLLEPPKPTIPGQMAMLVSPPPAPIFEYQRLKAEGGFQIYALDRSAYLKLPPYEDTPAVGADTARIIAIYNPKGVEQYAGQEVRWIGQDYLVVEIMAGRSGKLRMEGDFVGGPDFPDAVTFEILIKTSSGYNKLLTVGQGQNVIESPVEAGATEIMFIPVVVTAENADPGVRNLRIIDFK